MTSRIQNRRDTAANWTSNNPTLAAGELGFESDTGLFKLGNGTAGWTTLSYAGSSTGYTAIVSAAGTTVLTNSSTYYQRITGTTTQTIQLPSGTALPNGWTFVFDNDSTGSVTIVDATSATVDVIPSGGADVIYLMSNSTSAGSWGKYAYLPASVNWGPSTADFGGTTVSNATMSGITENNVTLTGTVTANSSAGVAGQVLTSTGTGVQWAAGSSDPTPTAFLLMGA
jgi:hypothetical protein